MVLSTLLVVTDEQTSYSNLPECILLKLRGYQMLRRMGVEFTNMQCNRQACSPSRSVLMSGIINTGVQDNIDQSYQNEYIPYLSGDVDTFGKICLKEGVETAYYGKNHVDSRLTSLGPVNFTENTTGSMRQYGIQKYSVFGDPGYDHGYINDPRTLYTKLSPTSVNYDHVDKNGNKSSGILPYLKSRSIDKKPFYLEYHIINPHDTQNFYQNLGETPKAKANQYTQPYLEKQLGDEMNPFEYSEQFRKAYVKNPNLTANYFEDTFEAYSTKIDLLPFKESFELSYVTDPVVGKIEPYLAGSQIFIEKIFTLAKDKKDIANWKNLINNYYGLIIEADSYLYTVLKFLEANNMLETTNVVFTADHGDMMSSHGLKQKSYPFKACMNVPLLIHSPKIHNHLKGTKSDVLCSLIDINKTLINLQFDEKISKGLTKNSKFLGKSILKNNGCNLKIDKNRKRFFHYADGFMFNLTYFGYVIFLKTVEISKVRNPPRNYFEYKSMFYLTISKINNEYYKYGKYYCIKDLIQYNVKDTIYYNKDILFPDLKSALPEQFTFEEGYEIVIHTYPLSSQVEAVLLLIEYFIFIDTSISSTGVTALKLPHKGDGFLYNITTDPQEIYNLKGIESYSKIEKYMKSELSLAKIENEMEKPTFILHVNELKKLATIIKAITNKNDDLNSLSNNKLILLGTLTGNNNYDAISQPSRFKAEILADYSNLLESIILA